MRKSRTASMSATFVCDDTGIEADLWQPNNADANILRCTQLAIEASGRYKGDRADSHMTTLIDDSDNGGDGVDNDIEE